MISVILMEPVRPGNVGAVARVMKNFSFDNLVLISPKCRADDPEALKRAKHGRDVLVNAVIADSYYLDTCDVLIGTTAVTGTDYNIARCPLIPRQITGKILGVKGHVGLLFGREGPGLSNEEVARCDFVVSIPASKKYPTLNISHAVAILLYEVYCEQKATKSVRGITPARPLEKKHLMRLFMEALDSIHYPNDYRREVILKVWKQVVGKSILTKREAFALMGFLRKIQKK